MVQENKNEWIGIVVYAIVFVDCRYKLRSVDCCRTAIGDGNVSLFPRHSDVPALTAMHGQQGIQLSPATNVNIATAFRLLGNHMSKELRGGKLLTANDVQDGSVTESMVNGLLDLNINILVLWGCVLYSYGMLLEVLGAESPSAEPKAHTIESNGEVLRIENKAKTRIFGFDSIKFSHYSRSRRNQKNSSSMSLERVRDCQHSISSTTSAGMVKQQHKLDEVSYHKLFDILKQYQNEVNELRAEKLERNVNPLALVATAQADRDPYYQTSRSHRSSAPSPKPSIPSRSHTTTRHKGKEIAKPITPPAETASEKDNNPEQAQRDKDMQKNLALIAKYFKKIYQQQPQNILKLQEQECGYESTEYGHFAKECRKPKRVKDFAYHKEKMLLSKQAEQGVPLYMAKIQEVPTADSGTDSEPVEQVQNEAGYNVFANHLQHSKQSESVSNTCLVETDDSNVIPNSLDMYEDDIQNEQNYVESNDEHVVLANLIVNLKLDVDENKKIQKQLKKANTTLAQELKECATILEETSKSLEESISVRDSCLVALQTKQNEFEKLIPDEEETLALERESRSKLNKDLVRPYDYTTLNSLYEIFKPPIEEYETQLAHANEIRRKMWRKYFVKSKLNIYKNVGFLPVSKSISKSRQAYNVMTNNINHFKEIVDNAWIKHSKDLFRAPTAQDIEILIQTCLMPLAIKTQGDSLKFVHELKQEMLADLKYVESLEKEIDELESNKDEFSKYMT
nr:hypothetical protein [Tanacetum cinerariifolium]